MISAERDTEKKPSTIILNARMHLLKSRGFNYTEGERDAAEVMSRLFAQLAKAEEVTR